ncbi:MAG: Methyltransferase type 11 [Solirubrobacterales bacterium]|nr:Methyltransferase type 11 [Solirubrobacterales bacterium]
MSGLYDQHAELYDIAFDWDVGDEVAWLLELLGPGCRTVLEPGCGSGRYLAALERAGVHAVGLDRSPAMIGRARRRAPGAEVFEADIAGFDLGRAFDGAVCPINTLGHLPPPALAHHLAAMARHLRSGARYLVQLDVGVPAAPQTWEAARGATRLRITWEADGSRIEILAGPRAGEVVESPHATTEWTAEAWEAAVEESPLRLADSIGGEPGGHLRWHVLTAR